MSLVRFHWPYTAFSVSLAGTFNHWTPQPMSLTPTGFTLSLPLSPNHTYQYKFLINHQTWSYDVFSPIGHDKNGNINNVIHVVGEVVCFGGRGDFEEKRNIAPKIHNIPIKHEKPPPIEGETKVDYWNDTYQFETTAQVLRVSDVPEKKEKCVILGNSLFYPQGGGQPSDVGIIEGDGGVFQVTSVRSEKGVIFHYGNFQNGAFKEGSEVVLKVDSATRVLHARLHSAGHLIDVAVQNLGLGWVPGKGYHFPAGPYVEYQGEVPLDKKAEIVSLLQEQMDNLVSAGSQVVSEIVKNDEVKEKCGPVPDYPKTDKVRVVTVAGKLGCPCGGTHVKNVRELGKVLVTKITPKKGTVRVSYKLG